jgi:serine/threonine protein kinase
VQRVSHSIGGKDCLGLEPGQILDGRFVIDSLIGAGGQGMVFKLRHLEWNRDFALKLPLPHVVRAENSRELYLKEAEAWIRLGVHPHIVRCWFVRPVAGLPGLFLDLMSGGSLESKIQSHAIRPGEWDKVLQVLLQVVEGLVHAHSQGMVHRDLKPENLMVASDGRLCITDFGLVKTLSEPDLTGGVGGPLPSNASVTAGAMGTPRYGAPEQWMDPRSVRPTTDLYSLGVIMFELLCGQRPFDPPGLNLSPIDIIQRHIAEPPPHPLSVRDDIPPEIADLCLRLLAKAPEERPQTSQEVLNALWETLHSRGNAGHQRPSSMPTRESPDLLNNAAASLYSLGKTAKARELLLRGLMIESGHPQCLYNLLLLDRREGKLGREEAIRRLKRAKALFELALLYIESGQGQEAAEILGGIPEEAKSGLLHRLEGDALMYAGKFDAARGCYQKAAQQMPNDLPTRFRERLAEKRATGADGRVHFPKLGSILRGRSHRPSVRIALSPDAGALLALDESEVIAMPIGDSSALKRATRGMYAAPVLWSDAHGSVLLLQDRNAFEFWSLAEFRLLTRIAGHVLARDSKLRRVLALTGEGLIYFDRSQQQTTPLTLAPELKVSPQTLAALTYDGSGIGLVTADGRLSSLSVSGQCLPLAWPPAIENARDLRHLCIGKEMVAVTYRSSLLRCFCLQEKKVTAELELGFLPDSLECDQSGTVIVASSPKAHLILDKSGAVLTRGQGPVALDTDKSLCLVWVDSCLRLYQLKPFGHLRTWMETIPLPCQLQISRDGRRALSVDEDGEYRVWEVDEKSRVFERSMLMTPGQSYAEIIAGFEQYQQELGQAAVLYEAKELYASYQSLRRARAVPGFQQAEEALELQWALCRQLQRDGLEAIWERLFLPDTVAGQLSADCRHLLLARPDHVELFSLSGPRIESKLKIRPGYQPISAHLLSDSGVIIVFGVDGELSSYRADTGELKVTQKLKTGRLSRVQLQSELALIQSASGQVFPLQLRTAKMGEPIPLLERTLKRAYLLNNQQVLLVTHQGPLIANLAKNRSQPGSPVEPETNLQEISFCADCQRSKLRIVGFANGELVLAQQKSGRSLRTLKLENGAVTAAVVHLETALAVAVTDQGGLTLFDLSQGEVIDSFVAHADGVTDLTLTPDGRYLTTRSSSGQFRLWELSWTLSDRPGAREIPWLPGSALDKLGKFFRGR